jgi:UDPglucose 6-dehydrogenase
MQRKITIIGTGYVGLTTGVCLAYLGHKVICVDKDKGKIKKLKRGISPIFEPGLEEFFKKNKERILFTDNLEEAIKASEIIFIAVGTPPRKDGNINLNDIKMAVEEIKKAMRNCQDYKVIAVKSTVPVGTSEWIKEEIRKVYGDNFSIVSNPEFLREGCAIKDFLRPDRIILGLEDKRAKKIMLDIYSSIKSPKIIADIRSAELIKYAANAFLATKISFINEIAIICEKTGGDVKKVAEGIGYDKRIGKYFLKAGIGFGGSCFPKDIDGLVKIADQKKYNFRLLKAVSIVNKNQQKSFIKKIKKILKKVNGDTICIWGLAFKPNTDDVRKSPAIEVIKNLQKAGYKIQAYDPVAMPNAKKELPFVNIKFCKNALLAAKDSDVLALITEWPEFSEIDMEKVRKLMLHPNLIDGRNIFEPNKMKNIGFYYEGVGRR